MLVWKNEMSSLCSLAISDSLRSCTLKRRLAANEFALLTSLLIVGTLASCSHDYAYARVAWHHAPSHGVRYAHAGRPKIGAVWVGESCQCGMETRVAGVWVPVIPYTPGGSHPPCALDGRGS